VLRVGHPEFGELSLRSSHDVLDQLVRDEYADFAGGLQFGRFDRRNQFRVVDLCQEMFRFHNHHPPLAPPPPNRPPPPENPPPPDQPPPLLLPPPQPPMLIQGEPQ